MTHVPSKRLLLVTDSLTRIKPSATTTVREGPQKPHKQGMIVSVEKPEVVLFLCILTVVLSFFLYFLQVKNISNCSTVWQVHQRNGSKSCIDGANGKKTLHIKEIYNVTLTKDVTIHHHHHHPQNTLCLQLQFMLTITVLILNKNYHL